MPLLSGGQQLLHVPPQRRAFVSGSTQRTHYETLGVPANASDSAIKKAYFAKAKATHPDLHPGDDAAKRKFQEVSNAYATLKSARGRADYDESLRNGSFFRGGGSSSGAARGGGFGGHPGSHAHWEAQQRKWDEMFQGVWAEMGAEAYVREVQAEVQSAYAGVKEGDWVEAQELVVKRKGLIFGVLLPLGLALRFPALVLGLAMKLGRVPYVLLAVMPPPMRAVVLSYLWNKLAKGVGRATEKVSQHAGRKAGEKAGQWARQRGQKAAQQRQQAQKARERERKRRDAHRTRKK